MLRPCLVAACLMATPALAQANADCPVFGQIVNKAAKERVAGTEMMDAMVTIAEVYTGSQQRFAGAVPLLVDWVWGLPENQLAEDVGAAYQEACEAR